jgi:hypothetical protein
MNAFDQMREAIREARSQIKAADSAVAEIASLIEGRLRTGGVSPSVLKALKRELKGFNIHTGMWMSK